jgi:TnsA endonuclease N terminal
MAIPPHEEKGFWEKGVRKISNRGVKKNIAKFPSLKMGRNIWSESTLESDYIYLLEFDQLVVKYKEQPFRINYIYQCKKYTYVPDFFVQLKNKFQVIEVKPKVKANTEANLLRYCIIRSILLNLGYEFVVATEDLIRIEPLLENVKKLWRYARTPIHPLYQVYCKDFLLKRQEATLQELAHALAPQGVFASASAN